MLIVIIVDNKYGKFDSSYRWKYLRTGVNILLSSINTYGLIADLII